MRPWRFGSLVLSGLAAFYLIAAVVVFMVSDRQLVTEGILATGSALCGALIVLLTKGWGDRHDEDEE